VPCVHLFLFPCRLVQIASASIFTALVPDLLFGPALYHCFTTAATVGYGDIALTTPEARLFACLHIVVSVSWLAALLSSVDTLRTKRESQMKRAALIEKPPQREQIMALDHDGTGCTQLEFVVGMLQILGVELCGEPLHWGDVSPFMILFDRLDVSKDRKLSQTELAEYVNLTELAMLELTQRKASSRGKSVFSLARSRGKSVKESARRSITWAPSADSLV